MSGPVLSPLDYPNPILHLDCDAYFTSVEQALNPALRGKPVVTGAERGIVACASYEAKALGIRRPMRLSDAKKECPSLIALESDYELYTLFSARLFSILRRFTPLVEEYSMDEAFGELSGLRRIFRKDYPEIAADIQTAVRKELGIGVSVGLSVSKTLAKIASQKKKPGGLTFVPANRLHEFLKEVLIKEVPGIGSNSTALLQKFGIETAWDYIHRPAEWVKKILGKPGFELWHELRGECVYSIQTVSSRPKASIHKCKTFTPTADKNFLLAEWKENLETAMRKLRRCGLRAQAFLLHVRDADFQSHGAQVKLLRPASSSREAGTLLQEFFLKLLVPGKKYRQTGVVLFDLSDENLKQFELFEDRQGVEKMAQVDRAVDGILKMHGLNAVFPGTRLFLAKERPPKRPRLRIPFWNIAV